LILECTLLVLKEHEEKKMKMKVGLWIDHREAVIVTLTGKGEAVELITSKVEKQLRRSGDSPLKGPHEPHQVPEQDSRKRAFKGHLNIYYDAVVASVRDAESILIFGPGDAKDELKERLEKHKLGGHIAGIETVDKMTRNQIVAKTRQRFPE
jgi:hypothetical protein